MMFLRSLSQPSGAGGEGRDPKSGIKYNRTALEKEMKQTHGEMEGSEGKKDESTRVVMVLSIKVMSIGVVIAVPRS